MQQMAHHARQPRPIRPGAIVSAAPLVLRPTAEVRRPPRLIGVLRRLYRLLFVQPIGRRAREERLGALSDGLLRDIGLKRVDLHAAAWGGVPLAELVPAYPSACTLRVCDRPRLAPTLVRLSEAA